MQMLRQFLLYRDEYHRLDMWSRKQEARYHDLRASRQPTQKAALKITASTKKDWRNAFFFFLLLDCLYLIAEDISQTAPFPLQTVLPPAQLSPACG